MQLPPIMCLSPSGHHLTTVRLDEATAVHGHSLAPFHPSSACVEIRGNNRKRLGFGSEARWMPIIAQALQLGIVPSSTLAALRSLRVAGRAPRQRSRSQSRALPPKSPRKPAVHVRREPRLLHCALQTCTVLAPAKYVLRIVA